jgi:hypothetical protein
MHTFNLKPKRLIKYPELCPVCGGTGSLKTLPVGTSWEEKDEIQAYVRIHLNCWKMVKNRNLLMSVILLLVVVGIIGILEWLGYSRFLGYIIAFPVVYILYCLFPKFIEISYLENEIELKFSNEKYASAFFESNCK